MKNEIITKVNKIGKAGQIITNIGKAILWIALVICILSGVALMAIPNDMIIINMENKATVEVNMPELMGMNTINEDGVSGITWGNMESTFAVGAYEYGVVGMEQTENGIAIQADTGDYALHFRNLANVLFMAAVYCVAILVVLHFIGVLCKKFKECETPFTEEIVQALKKLAISLIPMAFLSTLTESVIESVMTGNVNIVIGIDLMTVLLVLLVFLLLTIFSYGTMLQQESDETL